MAGKEIRQNDSLSPLLFNVVMDKVIITTKSMKGYKMANTNVNIIGNADDTVTCSCDRR